MTMHITGVHGRILFAGLTGMTLVACNLLLGRGYQSFDAPGGSSSATTSSGGGGDAATDGDAEVDGNLPPKVLWSTSFGNENPSSSPTVSAIAADLQGNIYLTGSSDPALRFGCTGDGGVNDTGSAYLVELDKDGKCQWLLRFGTQAQGTGVAFDPEMGTLALVGTLGTSTLSGAVTLDPSWTMSSANKGIDSFVALFDSGHNVLWARQITDGTSSIGGQVTTGVSARSGAVAVSAYYSSSISVEYPPGDGGASAVSIRPTSYAKDAVVIQFFDTSTTTNGGVDDALWITSLAAGQDQIANGVALDTHGNFAVAGTTSGPTSFLGIGGAMVPAASSALFLAACAPDTSNRFQTALGVLGSSATQDGGCIAFDAQGAVVAGGQFSGGLGLLGQDGGVSYTTSGGESVIVVRYDATGAPSGSLQFGDGTPNDSATIAGVAPYDAGIAFAGGFTGAAHFQDGGGSVSNPGATAVYVAQADGTLSNVRWAGSYGDGVNDQSADAIAVDPQGNIIVAGHFLGTLDFGTPDGGLVNTTGNDQIFVAKLTP